MMDWEPTEIGGALTGANVRWSVVALILLVLGGLAYAGFWAYRRPATQAAAASDAVQTQAATLRAQLPVLSGLTESLTDMGATADTASLFGVESAARELFQRSARLPQAQAQERSLSADAASSTLDAARLLGDAYSYRLAIVPVLASPSLETDPGLIELDEAARQFGAWQLRFDGVRTALPSGVMSTLSSDLDVLSGDLTAILGEYVDGLRDDDMAAAQAALDQLTVRLQDAESTLVAALEEIADRAAARVEEADRALALLVG